MQGHRPNFHDPVQLVLSPILVVFGFLFLVIGDPGQRIVGLLFLVTGGGWLLQAWRESSR